MALVPLSFAIGLCFAFTIVIHFLQFRRTHHLADTVSAPLPPIPAPPIHAAPKDPKSRCGTKGTCSCQACPRHKTNHPAPST